MIKTLSKLWLEGTYLNIIKAIYDKPTGSIILTGQKLQVFPLRSGTRQGCPLSPLLFNILLELLATTIRQKRNKRHPNCKGKSKTFFIFRWHNSVQRKPQRFYQETTFINEFSTVAGYKINIQKTVAFYIQQWANRNKN